jgi:hypothetical protein
MVLKVKRYKLESKVCAKSLHVRRAIYMRNTAIRIYRVPPFTRKNPSPKFHHGTKLWASRNIFAGLHLFEFCPNMAISQAKPHVAAPGAGLVGMPMEA